MGTRKLTIVGAMVMALAITLCSSVFAQKEAAKSADTLTGEQVFNKYVEAAGGKEAFAKLTSQYQRVTMELMANLKVTIETYQARPDKVRSTMSNDQIGKIERGYDGKLFWEKGTMTGVRVLEGQELIDAIREEAIFEKVTTWHEYYSKAELVGSDSSAGTMCFKVRVFPNGSPEQTWYFDKSSGFLVKIAMTMTTQMGTVPAEVVLSDYRKSDGVMMPFKMTTSAAGMNMAMVIDSVAHNIAIPDSVFAPPAEALELAKPKK